jgi:uncharacterized membrane protein
MRLFSIKPTWVLRGRKFKGIRGWAGKPSHPPLTDFPIVCLVLAAAFDLISFVAEDGTAVARDYFVAATFVLVAGQVTALLTAITGFWDWWRGLERDRSTGPIGRAKHTQVWRTANWHAIVMVTAVVVNGVNLIARLSDFGVAGATGLNLVLSLLGAGIISFGAAYGGTLVYDYQFNVEPLKGSTVWDETEVDQLPGERTKPPAS